MSQSSSASAAAGRAAPPRIGEFILEARLGKGGMGIVYLARKAGGGDPPRGGERVALKVLDAGGAGGDTSEAELVRRFEREADFMLSLEHPNLVRAYEVGVADGRHYLSMEYVEGENLAQRIVREMRVEPTAALGMMRQVAAGLCYGADRGVVHRDLKPENILIRRDGVCKLADMGLAILARREDLRLTAPGTTLGTPSYMSPEQARAERDIDQRSDIYSLACTFYHALCGRPPFVGANAIEIVNKHLRSRPMPPSSLAPGLSEEGEAILLKCLEKDRAHRFRSCDEVAVAIDSVLSPPAPVRAGLGVPGAAPAPVGASGPASGRARPVPGRATARAVAPRPPVVGPVARPVARLTPPVVRAAGDGGVSPGPVEPQAGSRSGSAVLRRPVLKPLASTTERPAPPCPQVAAGGSPALKGLAVAVFVLAVITVGAALWAVLF